MRNCGRVIDWRCRRPGTRRPLRGLQRRCRRTHPGPECPTANRPGKMGRAATGASPGTAGRSAVVTPSRRRLPHLLQRGFTPCRNHAANHARRRRSIRRRRPVRRRRRRTSAVCLSVGAVRFPRRSPLAMAFLDRLVDRAIILKIKGKSYRASRSIKSPSPSQD